MTRLQKFLNWLKSLFINQKEESAKMSEALNDTAVAQPTATEQETVAVVADAQTAVVADPVTPAAEVKAGVQDFEKAYQFVTDGAAVLGEAAKDELFALAKKYL